MAEILNGRQAYRGSDGLVTTLLTETTDAFVKLLDLGWGAKDATYDLIQWRDRYWNPVADRLANEAMDKKQGSEWWVYGCPTTLVNYMVFVDGGKRESGETSSAYAIFALRGGLLRLVGHGAYYGRDRDPFVSECRSMWLASTRLASKLGLPAPR